MQSETGNTLASFLVSGSINIIEMSYNTRVTLNWPIANTPFSQWAYDYDRIQACVALEPFNANEDKLDGQIEAGTQWKFVENDYSSYRSLVFHFILENDKIYIMPGEDSAEATLPSEVIADLVGLTEVAKAAIKHGLEQYEIRSKGLDSSDGDLEVKRYEAARQILRSLDRDGIEAEIDSLTGSFTLNKDNGKWVVTDDNDLTVEHEDKVTALAILLACLRDESLVEEDEDDDEEDINDETHYDLPNW